MKLTQIIAILAISAVFFACNNQNASKSEMKTQKDSTSYALGALQAEGFLDQMEKFQVLKHIDTKWFLKGAEDYTSGEKAMDFSSVQMTLSNVIRKIQADSAYAMPEASTGEEMQNVSDSFGYALGAQLVEGINRTLVQMKATADIDSSFVMTGINDVMTDSSQIDQKTGTDLLNKMVQKARAAQMEAQQQQESANAEQYADNKKAGEDFLEENKQRPEVKVTESGLQYEVLKKGTGASPAATDQVKVHYHGTLIDGTVFDSSVERGEPITFGLNQVIPGWTEGVQLMKEGAKYKFYIPQELAYGGADKGKIKPYSTLIFEVELLEVVK
ncbi:MAG TPA: FKBP-type peptidyl-prolyl cis-trans isomerase [Salinivirga sp.]|uniref:FKBP-type peptidyl-prolyl cis-trans isomerase n=1 Tax=Salinivirga sp. TaxID=1970192 RepID=UPI002B49563C|nr:FKBP-type peptidyl-prolyl cis-trans isomerase [Salinivirga sp.]HKK60793.1 FKBP-type peptidyl-prolyl cis-trans isomerase [Salinivirga sp.]